MSGNDGYVQFVNDDDGYLRWLASNPSGFVVNSHRVPVASYLVLHRASCRWINTGAKNNWTTTGYIKTCSASVLPLEAWAKLVASGNLKPCGACNPAYRPPVGSHPSQALEAAEHSDPPHLPTPAPGPITLAGGPGGIPSSISNGCPELDRAWASYAARILRSNVPIPDTDDDLNWHAFLGHSIDMQGFRAAEFAGVDPLTRMAPAFVPLKARGIGVPGLAALWEVAPIRRHLTARTDHLPLDATLQVLQSHGGAVGSSLAEAFRHFPWRKFHWSVRALL